MLRLHWCKFCELGISFLPLFFSSGCRWQQAVMLSAAVLRNAMCMPNGEQNTEDGFLASLSASEELKANSVCSLNNQQASP